MPSELTLTYKDENGRPRQAAVRHSPFSVGRGPDNDLVIPLSALSRRHARIDILDGKPYLSDCGSSNGTTHNGRPLTSAVELRDGDRVELGNACTLSVSLRGRGHAPGIETAGAGTHAGGPAAPLREAASAAPSTPLPTTTIIAGAFVGLLLLGSVTLFLVRSGGGEGDEQPPAAGPAETVDVKPAQGSGGTGAAKGAQPVNGAAGAGVAPAAGDGSARADEGTGAGDADDEQIAGAIRAVLRRISTDQTAYISEQGVKDVAAQVREYRGSSALAERLRAMARGRAEVMSLARSHNLKPTLLTYAALAQTEGGGDPVAAARQMTPKLLTLRATFGTETANSSLLLVAAYPYPFNPPIGSQTRTPHPLAARLTELGGRRSVVDTSVARSVWFLREKGGLTDEAYRLVVRLLAVGVIAQGPRRYGVEAEPLL